MGNWYISGAVLFIQQEQADGRAKWDNAFSDPNRMANGGWRRWDPTVGSCLASVHCSARGSRRKTHDAYGWSRGSERASSILVMLELTLGREY